MALDAHYKSDLDGTGKYPTFRSKAVMNNAIMNLLRAHGATPLHLPDVCDSAWLHITPSLLPGALHLKAVCGERAAELKAPYKRVIEAVQDTLAGDLLWREAVRFQPDSLHHRPARFAGQWPHDPQAARSLEITAHRHDSVGFLERHEGVAVVVMPIMLNGKKAHYHVEVHTPTETILLESVKSLRQLLPSLSQCSSVQNDAYAA